MVKGGQRQFCRYLSLTVLSHSAISPRARDTIRDMVNKNWRLKLGRAPDDGTARSRHHLGPS